MDTIAGLAVHGARRRAAGRVVPWGARTELYVQPYIQHGVGVEGKGRGRMTMEVPETRKARIDRRQTREEERIGRGGQGCRTSSASSLPVKEGAGIG